MSQPGSQLPSGTPYGTITATLVRGDGTPLVGTVRFLPDLELITDASNVIDLSQVTTVTLDEDGRINGSAGINLIADITYLVQSNFTNGTLPTRRIAVLAGVTSDLSDLLEKTIPVPLTDPQAVTLAARAVQAAEEALDYINQVGGKVLVLGSSDPVPPGTPDNTLIFRPS